MNKKIFLIAGFSSLLLFSCKKPPTACMEMSATAVNNATPIEFTSCSENALSFEWDMRGPEGAPENFLGWSDEIFTHKFTVPGTYTVTLHAYENFSFTGEFSTAEATVVIN